MNSRLHLQSNTRKIKTTPLFYLPPVETVMFRTTRQKPSKTPLSVLERSFFCGRPLFVPAKKAQMCERPTFYVDGNPSHSVVDHRHHLSTAQGLGAWVTPGWWFQPTPLKNMSSSVGNFIKHVPNHQPEMIENPRFGDNLKHNAKSVTPTCSLP